MDEITIIAGKEIEDKVVDVSTGTVYTRQEYLELIKALLDE